MNNDHINISNVNNNDSNFIDNNNGNNNTSSTTTTTATRTTYYHHQQQQINNNQQQQQQINNSNTSPRTRTLLLQGRFAHCSVTVDEKTLVIGGVVPDPEGGAGAAEVAADDVLVFDWNNPGAGWNRRDGGMVNGGRAYHACANVSALQKKGS